MKSLKHVRYALLLVAAFLYLADTGSAFRSPFQDGRVVATAQGASLSRSFGSAAPAVTSSLLDECWEVCGETTECEEPCMFYPPPPFDGQEITCGIYDGGGANGQCIGECGDDYCNGGAGEDPEQCVEDCGYCGDGICDTTFAGENSTDCYEDCGECGDGACHYSEVCGQVNECEDDCNNCDNMGDDCSPAFEECGFPGDVCNPRHYCVTPGGRGCGSDEHGCCANEIWYETPGANCLPTYGCGMCIPYGPAESSFSAIPATTSGF